MHLMRKLVSGRDGAPDNEPEESALSDDALIERLVTELQRRYPSATVNITFGPASAAPAPSSPAPVVSTIAARPPQGGARPVRTAAPPTNQNVVPNHGAEQCWEGRLLAAGVQSRTDSRTGESYNHYGIELDTGVGAPVRIWGVDLERALASSGAQPGDTIVVEKKSSIEVGRGHKKTIYDISVSS